MADMKNIRHFVKNYPKSVYIFSLVFAHTRIIASVQVKILYGIDSARYSPNSHVNSHNGVAKA